MPRPVAHPDRKEIARYLLSLGLELEPLRHPPPPRKNAWHRRRRSETFRFRTPLPLRPRSVALRLRATPRHADVVASHGRRTRPMLSPLLHPRYEFRGVVPYDRRYADRYKPLIRPGCTRTHSQTSRPLHAGHGSRPVGALCEVRTPSRPGWNRGQGRSREGTRHRHVAVKDFFGQVIAETVAGYMFTIGTAGSVVGELGLGDVIMTRAAG